MGNLRPFLQIGRNPRSRLSTPSRNQLKSSGVGAEKACASEPLLSAAVILSKLILFIQYICYALYSTVDCVTAEKFALSQMWLRALNDGRSTAVHFYGLSYCLIVGAEQSLIYRKRTSEFHKSKHRGMKNTEKLI